MDWKAQIEGEESTITKLQAGNNPAIATIIRDGVGWFLESPEFTMLSDHMDVRAKANSILTSMVESNSLSGDSAKIAIGSIIRIHYDNSKSVFRAEG